MSAKEKVLSVSFVIVSTLGAALFLAPERPNLLPWESAAIAAVGGFLWGIAVVFAGRSALRHFGQREGDVTA